jgi:hypothetical protein
MDKERAQRVVDRIANQLFSAPELEQLLAEMFNEIVSLRKDQDKLKAQVEWLKSHTVGAGDDEPCPQ